MQEVSFSLQPALEDELWYHSQDRNSVLLSSWSVTASGVSATPSQAADAGTAHLSHLAILFLRSFVAKVSFPLGLWACLWRLNGLAL